MQFTSAADNVAKSAQVVLSCAPAACKRRAEESRMKELESFILVSVGVSRYLGIFVVDSVINNNPVFSPCTHKHRVGATTGVLVNGMVRKNEMTRLSLVSRQQTSLQKDTQHSIETPVPEFKRPNVPNRPILLTLS